MRRLFIVLVMLVSEVCIAKPSGHWESLGGPSAASVGSFYTAGNDLFVLPSAQLQAAIYKWSNTEKKWEGFSQPHDKFVEGDKTLYALRSNRSKHEVFALKEGEDAWKQISPSLRMSKILPSSKAFDPVTLSRFFCGSSDPELIVLGDNIYIFDRCEGALFHNSGNKWEIVGGSPIDQQTQMTHQLKNIKQTSSGLYAINVACKWGSKSEKVATCAEPDLLFLGNSSSDWKVEGRLPHGDSFEYYENLPFFVVKNHLFIFTTVEVRKFSLNAGNSEDVTGLFKKLQISAKTSNIPDFHVWNGSLMALYHSTIFVLQGDRWVQISRGFPVPDKMFIKELIVDGSDMFVVVDVELEGHLKGPKRPWKRYDRIYKYNQGGWKALPDAGLPSAKIPQMEIADVKTLNGDIYVSLPLGVYVLRQGDSVWQPMNAGFWPMGVLKIAADGHQIFANGLLFGLGGYANCATYRRSVGEKEWTLLTSNYGQCAEKMSIENGKLQFEEGRISQEAFKNAKNKLGIPGVKKVYVDYTSSQGVRYVGTDRGVFQWVQ